MGQFFFWLLYILVHLELLIFMTDMVTSSQEVNGFKIDWVASSIARMLYQYAIVSHHTVITKRRKRAWNATTDHSGMIGFHRFYYLVSSFIQSNTIKYFIYSIPWKSRKCTLHTQTHNLSHNLCKKNGIMQSTASIETTMMAMTCILTVANVCERRKKPNHKISVWNRGTSSCRTFAWFTRSMHVHLSIVR